MGRVKVDSVTVRYGNFNALNNLTHEFASGTATAVMGVNGSGKTTLLECIAGLIKPTMGQLDDVPAKLAYVCQHNRSSWMPLTASEVLAMGRYQERGLVGWFRHHDRAVMDQAGELLDINHLRNKNFGELSGGQQQRVRIAQGLASEPDLLLLDEPITGLDIPSQDRILGVIEEYANNGSIVIITTHHIDEARHCEEVILLANSLIASGPPSEMLTETMLRDAFGQRLLCGQSEHFEDCGMIVMDDHGHGSQPPTAHTLSPQTPGDHTHLN